MLVLVIALVAAGGAPARPPARPPISPPADAARASPHPGRTLSDWVGLDWVGLGYRHRALNEAGVAILPGTDFGAMGAGHIRISYVKDNTVLKKGLDRLEKFVKGLATEAKKKT